MMGCKFESIFGELLWEAFDEPLHLVVLSAWWDALSSRSALSEPQGVFIPKPLVYLLGEALLSWDRRPGGEGQRRTHTKWLQQCAADINLARLTVCFPRHSGGSLSFWVGSPLFDPLPSAWKRHFRLSFSPLVKTPSVPFWGKSTQARMENMLLARCKLQQRKRPTSLEWGEPLMIRTSAYPPGRRACWASTSGFCTTGPLNGHINSCSQCPVYFPLKNSVCFIFMDEKFFQNKQFHKCTTGTKKTE